MKKRQRRPTTQPATIAEQQTLLATFREPDNQLRPHRSL
jgi:hypothetical protein